MDLNKFPELKSTYIMIKCAFPNAISSDEYFSLLDILYSYLSDRSLATLMAEITGKDYSFVLNDVYGVGVRSKSVNTSIKNDCLQKLKKCNFDKWQQED